MTDSQKLAELAAAEAAALAEARALVRRMFTGN
jgi:hypothetical protein